MWIEIEGLGWGPHVVRETRRQHPLDIFMADFYCHERKLIIELDGGIHDTSEQIEYDQVGQLNWKRKALRF